MTGLLVDAAMRTTVVVSAGLVALWFLESHSAAFRHWVLAAAVGSAWATIPLATVMPAWMHASVVRTSERAIHSDGAPQMMRPAGVDLSEIVSTLARPSVDAQPRHSLGLVQWLEWLWVLGALASAVVIAFGFARLRRIAAGAREVDAPDWTTTCDQLRHAYGLSSGIRLLQSDHPSLLVTWGWRRPTIVLPAAAQSWSGERISVVLAHECSHVARGDWVVQMAAEALRALCWFNPLMWLVSRRLRNESERACDDAVLMRGIPAATYAGHLLDLTRRLHPVRPTQLPALAMARRSGLEGRIVAMLNASLNRAPASGRARLIASAGLVALTLLVATLHAQPSLYTLEGTVRDPSDRVLPEATLVLTNADSRAKYEVHANALGHYEFVGLPPASYTLSVSQIGFSNFTETLKINSDVTHDLRLPVGELQESITVTGRPPAVPTADPAILQRREAARRTFDERRARAKAQCAAGADATIGGNLLPPAKLVDVRPVYPEHLKASNVGGIVTMDAVIGVDGLVREIDNVHGPDPALEQAAADAVRQWQFTTTLLNCEPIEVNMHVTTQFKAEP
jgi:beta-lactamase regulating signal transducer with metallopeptidase domain